MWIPDGVNEQDDHCFIYPNPSNGLIYIAGSVAQKVEIFSLTGQLVFEQQGNLEKINVENLENGFYFVRLRFVSGERNMKLLIEK